MYTLVSYSEVGNALVQEQKFNNPVLAMDFGNRIAGMAAVGQLHLFEDEHRIASRGNDGKWR